MSDKCIPPPLFSRWVLIPPCLLGFMVIFLYNDQKTEKLDPIPFYCFAGCVYLYLFFQLLYLLQIGDEIQSYPRRWAWRIMVSLVPPVNALCIMTQLLRFHGIFAIGYERRLRVATGTGVLALLCFLGFDWWPTYAYWFFVLGIYVLVFLAIHIRGNRLELPEVFMFCLYGFAIQVLFLAFFGKYFDESYTKTYMSILLSSLIFSGIILNEFIWKWSGKLKGDATAARDRSVVE